MYKSMGMLLYVRGTESEKRSTVAVQSIVHGALLAVVLYRDSRKPR